jgi:cysteinyl-tRNA synthetase
MTLRLYNTLTRRKEDFAPLDPANVRMYVCGPTVYDFAHIGNARPVIVFDVLYRLLKHLYPGEGTASDGSRVTYVRNITDIDDRINARAAEVAAARGISVEAARAEITAATAKQYEEDVAALGCLPPTHTPRATQYVPQMIAMIETLIAAGHAYVAEGHVLYDVASKPDYGKLARRTLDEMLAGARVEVAPYKKNPMDFVLWKPSDDQTPGWESSWGRGRPGWHIECSAMGGALLGETFDIHGGGIDLMFPHHENEIAQSEGAHHDHPLARVWMHNGFLQVEGEKMSKSLGNFVTNYELLETQTLGGPWAGGVIRLAMLQTHYRQPINWTRERLSELRSRMFQWCTGLAISKAHAELRKKRALGVAAVPHPEVLEALCDDLNTPRAITALQELHSKSHLSEAAELVFLESLEFLGLVSLDTVGAYDLDTVGWGLTGSSLLQAKSAIARMRVMIANGRQKEAQEVADSLKEMGLVAKITASGWITVDQISSDQSDDIQALIDARNAARKAKNFKEADRIRDELLAQGIVLKDNADGTTTWEVKR